MKKEEGGEKHIDCERTSTSSKLTLSSAETEE